MLSLKRLLNHEAEDGHRSSRSKTSSNSEMQNVGWYSDTNGITNQSWPEISGSWLGTDLGDGVLDYAFDSTGIPDILTIGVDKDISEWDKHSALEKSTPNGIQQEPAVDASEQICYGMIYRSLVQLRGDMLSLYAKIRVIRESDGSGHILFKLNTSHSEEIVLVFPDDSEFGVLNDQHSNALREFNDACSIKFEAVCHKSILYDTIARAAKASDAKIRIDINVYGPRSSRNNAGDRLSLHRIYLQKPDIQRIDYAYENPHVVKFPEILSSTSLDTKQTKAVTDNAEPAALDDRQLQKMLQEVYGSLKRGTKLDGLKGDEKLNTQLLTHQEQALEFMIQRESGKIPEEFRLWKPIDTEGRQWYINTITNERMSIPYEEKGGGILADEMGMGKSLSILSLIMRTLEDGEEWTKEIALPEDIASTKRRSKATLVIVSSALLMNGWFEEIRHHLAIQLKTLEYHGPRREDYISTIGDNDIIITTYHTLSSDFRNKRSILHDIAWYRLVLDEAHIIRRQATEINRTVSELTAKSRWCLTGTPIQNRLEDIGALFAFLRVRPFNSMANFRRYIVAPFEESEAGREQATRRLTTLIDSLCLRRTKGLLHLPEEQHCTRLLEFSLYERDEYERTKKTMIQIIKQRAGEYDRQNTFGMFQAQLQLRVMCNHGSFQQHFQFQRLSLRDEQEGAFYDTGENSDADYFLYTQSTPGQGQDKMCGTSVQDVTHVPCSEYLGIPDGDGGLEIREGTGWNDGHSRCRPCSSTYVTKEVNPEINSRQFEESDDVCFRPLGYSTKMVALMHDVKNNLAGTKSIIFSCWTRTLNLVGKHLVNENIRFERIDGECPFSRRQRILDCFASDCSVPVLIMTTGTGAFGLNLTCANRVFIVEPQWNPSVENQAIARALRLGQKRQVLVTRYVIKNTIEQEMRSQQERKLRMAEVGFDTEPSVGTGSQAHKNVCQGRSVGI